MSATDENNTQGATANAVASSDVVCAERSQAKRRGISPALAMWLLPAMAMAGCFRRNSYRERHDPNRPKTQADLDAIAAAEAKRQRRAAKRAAHTDQTEATA